MKCFKVLLPTVAIALVLASCAPKLPQADVLAPDSFKAASDANDALQANLKAQDYGKTKDLAKALTTAAAKAKADAAAGLETAKADVAQLGTDIAAEIPALQKVYAKAAAKKAKVDLKGIKAALEAAPKALADDQALSDVVAAKIQLTALKTALDGDKTALENAGFKE